jgi:hypothetical protein
MSSSVVAQRASRTQEVRIPEPGYDAHRTADPGCSSPLPEELGDAEEAAKGW